MKEKKITNIDVYQEQVFKPFTREQDKLAFINGCIGSIAVHGQEMADSLQKSLEEAKTDENDETQKVIELDIAELGNLMAITMFDLACLSNLLGIPMSKLLGHGIKQMKEIYPQYYDTGSREGLS